MNLILESCYFVELTFPNPRYLSGGGVNSTLLSSKTTTIEDNINSAHVLTILNTTKTGTTDGNGNMVLIDGNYKILDLWSTSHPSSVCLLFKSNNYWQVRVINNSNSYVPLSSTSVTIKFEYMSDRSLITNTTL